MFKLTKRYTIYIRLSLSLQIKNISSILTELALVNVLYLQRCLELNH